MEYYRCDWCGRVEESTKLTSGLHPWCAVAQKEAKEWQSKEAERAQERAERATRDRAFLDGCRDTLKKQQR
jgi:hypothetical protein